MGLTAGLADVQRGGGDRGPVRMSVTEYQLRQAQTADSPALYQLHCHTMRNDAQLRRTGLRRLG
jgi:hypothetical protein